MKHWNRLTFEVGSLSAHTNISRLTVSLFSECAQNLNQPNRFKNVTRAMQHAGSHVGYRLCYMQNENWY